MPIPFLEECQESMQSVWSGKSDIVAAIDKIKGLATDETWSGPPADSWMTDLNGHIADAMAALGQPLDDAVQQCYKHAQDLQAQSAKQAAKATAGG